MTPRLGVWRWIGTVVFAVAGLSELFNAITVFTGYNDSSVNLAWIQVVSGLLSFLLAEGIYRRRGSAAWVSLAWGVWVGMEILMIGPLLMLDPDERRGLLPGAGLMLVVGIGLAWLLATANRRSVVVVDKT